MKQYVIFCLLLSSFLSFSQTEIARQGFENAGETWNYTLSTPECTSGGDIWNRINNIGTISPYEGQWFWGIRDLYGDCGSNAFETLTFDSVDVSAYRDVELRFWYTVFEFDNGDDMKYELIFDGVSQGEILFFEGNSNRSTNGWEEVLLQIPNAVSQVAFKIYVKQNADTDYAGIDAVSLSGNVIEPCSELLISEYVEGTSNNKYIELYNPTGSDIDLSAYNLTRYVGENTSPTGNLQLSGMISAYGVFLIENQNESLGITADMSTGSVMTFNGDDKIALRKGNMIIDLIGVIGTADEFAKDVTLRRKSNIQSPNIEYNPNEWEVYPVNTVNDLKAHVSVCSGPIPEIAVYGNQVEIIDGANLTQIENGTYFGEMIFENATAISQTFTVKNTGDALLQVDNIQISGADTSDFTLGSIDLPVSIPSGDSLVVTIDFNPVQMGLRSAKVEIRNNDASESMFDFTIQAESTGGLNGGLLITQYYEGTGNNRWLEITNTGLDTVPSGTYFVALYKREDGLNPQSAPPSNSREIPELPPGKSLLFRTALATEPAYAVTGNEIVSPVCNFNGDDVLILTTSNDQTAWGNKVDRLGNFTNWGENTSFVRLYSCSGSHQNTGFEPLEWKVYGISEVDSIQTGYNRRLGSFFKGETVFVSGNWTNGLPSSGKSAVILDTYQTDLNGSFEACSLVIDSGATVRIAAGDYLSVTDLEVNGNLDIENNGSLYMPDDLGQISGSGLIKVRRTATGLKTFDYTYWASPVKNAVLEEVFAESPQNAMYSFDTREFEDNDNDNEDDTEPFAWKNASGLMNPGSGYAVMAPNTDNFNGIQEVVFQGMPNNGLIETPVFLSEKDTVSANNWNLLGNPYPSAIDAQAFLSDSVNAQHLGSTLYFWTHNTALSNGAYSSADYAIYNLGTGGVSAGSGGRIPNGFIASGQGFFVNALSEGRVRFTNAMRVKTGNDNFFRSVHDKDRVTGARIWLNLSSEQGAFSQILIGFFEEASSSYEPYFDAIRLPSNRFLSFFSVAEGLQLAIQGTASVTEESEIVLGFETKIAEKQAYEIGIAKIEGAFPGDEILLWDDELQIYHNLKESAYQFELEAAALHPERFKLLFQRKLGDNSNEDVSENPLILRDFPDYIEVGVANNREIYSVKVYDFLGKLLISEKVGGSAWRMSKAKLAKNTAYFIVAQILNDRYYVKRFLLH